MSIADGANYAPTTDAEKVVGPGEFPFAAAFLDHGHIRGQVNGLRDAGATLTHVYDPDPDRLASFREAFPEAQAVDSFQALLDNTDIKLIAAAAVPSERAAIGQQVLRAGKDYFTDKCPFTTIGQLRQTEEVVAQTGGKYMVYFAERLHNDAAWQAGELISGGAIGRILQVINIAPHRLAKATRPAWFFDKARYGGIITDIGSHQVEQFLSYAGCSDAEINFSRVANFNNPDKPGLEDFGEFSMTGDNGASFYSRVDWFTPDGLRSWGDGRCFILGTEGSIEVRKYLDIARDAPCSKLFVADQSGEREIDCLNRSGFPFFGQLIRDCLERTESAMSQTHVFRSAELSLKAQTLAETPKRS